MLFPFFFNDTATTEIYTLSLHDALPIFLVYAVRELDLTATTIGLVLSLSNLGVLVGADRKSTRLNSSHITISYAVFCLKKKNKKQKDNKPTNTKTKKPNM